MDRSMTDKLDMAARVQEFQQAHTYSDRNQATVAAKFAERLEEAQTLFLAEHSQEFAAKAAVRHRQDLRRRLETHVMRNVARVGAIAMREDAQVARRFVTPPRDKSIAAFVAQATSLLEVAREQQEALARFGLTRAQFAEFASGLNRFREATAEAQGSRRQLVETRAALKRAVAELSEMLELLDVFNRARFEKDATLLGLWSSVRSARVGRRRGGRSADRGAVSETPAAPPVRPPVDVPVSPSHPAPPVVESPVVRPVQSGDEGGDEPPHDGGLTKVA